MLIQRAAGQANVWKDLNGRCGTRSCQDIVLDDKYEINDKYAEPLVAVESANVDRYWEINRIAVYTE
jgi:hypothetical protein